ncbi:hypothetical protein [Winogradskyella eximia]|uniref:hypothetical protein n=1 Tax=Winogradskyella eximia TaxID=262006 RepID=UPI002492554F|nr:hypothetical protein [Winogradskyella eximia]
MLVVYIFEASGSRKANRVGNILNFYTMKKLELKNLKVKKVSREEQASVNGGLLSIGHQCSHRNFCERLRTKCWGNCDDDTYITDHFDN